MYQLVDLVTKKVVVPNGLVFTGEDTPWEVVMDLAAIKSKLNLDYFRIAPSGLSKYLSLMPINTSAEFVSLREVATPFITSKTLSKQLGTNLYFKVEGKNPTGS